MLAAGWAAPGYPMQSHVAVSAHTIGTVVVIDKASPELGALPTNHLGWQVGKNSVIPVGLPLQCTNSHSGLHSLPLLRGCPLRSGPLGYQPVCSIALPLPFLSTLTCPQALQWCLRLVMELKGSWQRMHMVTSFSRMGVGARFPRSTF